jgi:hypothetical protein
LHHFPDKPDVAGIAGAGNTITPCIID